GIATVTGLDHVQYGEILLFPAGVRGMAQDLREGETGCILFDEDGEVCQGGVVRRTGRTAGVPVGDALIGRVVNALGAPLDGLGDIQTTETRPIENPAPGILDRRSVNRPLETGILAIDSMFPIGRGQRELIIGDRQTGKTAIALDTILNQKGKDVICIYVSIGQKAGSVAQLVRNLRDRGAMDYTVVVHASASDPAPLQYIAPYAGCAMGEYFMERGRDVLIVYDDLSKHAIAYRSLSLLLGRSPGREAYPGDVFYLHSRLLERAAQLSEERGGGSMTALPVVETQAGDVAAYVPTNIISITDGQIFLESSLFFAGQRPAVNVGLSVSRVGGDAQTKAMKTASGAIRLDLAQYREMEVFTQFASDLDDSTRSQLAYGQRLMRLLRQDQYHPLRQYQQVVLLTAVMGRVFDRTPLEEMGSFAQELLAWVQSQQAGLCDTIECTGRLSLEDKEEILRTARDFAAQAAAERRW
ncbi:MAG: F0F1 ATP synthase subunit alpha, partial [Oscillospiraceae bacterium]|nr:F0F1 ATP synthase subunit alpha [Oscillospiraceae bacterium]